MRFALIDGQRTAAQPGLTGLCPGCGKPLLPKCGTRRVWHWAHRGERSCDPWWEPESTWHRAWKDEFPSDWQEVVHFADSGEKHIADVKTPHGLVVEFQHSHISPAEQSAREQFYGNMVWVVDGTRLKRDLPRFLKAKDDFLIGPSPLKGVSTSHFPDEVFPASWISSSVLVVFDFAGVASEDSAEAPCAESRLWLLLPGRAEGRALLGSLPRATFLQLARERPSILNVREIVGALSDYYRQQRQMEAARYYANYSPRLRQRRYVK